MTNWLLQLGAALDRIGPLVSGLEEIANGPRHTLRVPRQRGWSGRDVERLLHQHGIKTWGLHAPASSATILVTVRHAQARWAAYVLRRQGIAVESGSGAFPGGPVPGGGSGAGTPAERSGAGDWIDKLGDLLWS